MDLISCASKKKKKAPAEYMLYCFLPLDDEEEEGSCDTDEVQDYRAPPSRDITLSSSMIGPSPSSIVKLEANQKARNKKQRQELYGKTYTSYQFYLDSTIVR